MELRAYQIKYLDYHHTAGSEVDTQAVRQEHINQGWADIGYNLVIEPNGTVGVGRDPKYIGAHDIGKVPGELLNMNLLAYSICCIGNFEVNAMSESQYQSLLKESVRVAKVLKIPIERFRRHGDHYATACPGKNFPWKRLINEAGVLLKGEELNVLNTVVVFWTAKDYSVAAMISEKLGNCLMTCRNGNVNINPDAKSAKHLIVVGGPEIKDHPNVTNLCGEHAPDTAILAATYAKGL